MLKRKIIDEYFDGRNKILKNKLLSIHFRSFKPQIHETNDSLHISLTPHQNRYCNDKLANTQ